MLNYAAGDIFFFLELAAGDLRRYKTVVVLLAMVCGFKKKMGREETQEWWSLEGRLTCLLYSSTPHPEMRD